MISKQSTLKLCGLDIGGFSHNLTNVFIVVVVVGSLAQVFMDEWWISDQYLIMVKSLCDSVNSKKSPNVYKSGPKMIPLE